LRRARKAKVIPPNSTAVSPKAAPASVFPFSPSQLVNQSYGGISPQAMMFTQSGQIVNDSPSSGGGDIFEFDSLFAQETLERAGLKLGEGDQLPL
jgi:hypothetical protein